MQLPIIGHRGQVKPYGSIPRINWAHPLADGLVSYGYDIGSGPIDLVTGGQVTIANSSNPPFGGPKPSKYGSALTSIQTAGSVTTGLFNLPTSADIVTTVAAAPYSFACGFMFTATPPTFTISNVFCVCDATAGRSFGICVAPASTTDFAFSFATGSTNNTASGLNVINAFNTALGVALTGSTTACYVNGVLAISPAVTTTGAGLSGSRPSFFGKRSEAGQTVQSGYIYYGAIWKGRALTASEARLLHDDPYCFLIYPEDEMFASLVPSPAINWPPGGATGAPIIPVNSTLRF